MSPVKRIMILSTLGAIAVGGPALGEDDTVGSSFIAGTDTKEDFSAGGILRSNDNSNPPNGITITTKYKIPNTANWEFSLAHSVESWNIEPGVNNGAQNAYVRLSGIHKVPPHHNEQPNTLPEIKSDGTDIPYGASKVHTKWNTVVHGPRRHYDGYGFRANVTAFPATPDPNAQPRHVSGAAVVEARHRGSERFANAPDGWVSAALGSTPDGGAMVTFLPDPEGGVLLLSMNAITILDTQAGSSGGIDPQFANDPILNAQYLFLPLHLAGIDPGSGNYIFIGGGFIAQSPEDIVRIAGTMHELEISSTLPGLDMGAFGVFASLSMTETVPPDDGGSVWAEQFADLTLFGNALSNEERKRLLFPVITFTTDVDLVNATSNFTEPAKLPATILLTTAVRPPSIPGDLNDDGVVDGADLLILLSAWGECADPGNCPADLNHDGVVDGADLLILLSNWG